MKKRTPDRFWFPFWPDKWIFGSIRIECSVAERGIWVDLLSLASKDDGHIRANEETPYPLKQLSGMLLIPEDELHSAIEKFIKLEKITRTETGTLYVIKWDKYQFTDRHKRRVEGEMSEETDIVSEKRTPNKIKEKEIKEEDNKEYSPEFESFWNEYPKHKGKKLAYNAWKEHPKKNHIELEVAAQNYKKICDYKKTDPEFIKDASGFIRLSKEYWKDYLKFEMPYQVGQSKQVISTEKKKADDDYVEARLKKENELLMSYAQTIPDFDKRNDVIQNELAKWTKEYYDNPA